MLLYFCTFFHKKYTGFSSCCTFCGLTTYTTSSLLLYLYIWTLLLVVSHFLTPKVLYSLFFHLLSPYTYSFFHSTLYYSICYHLKFILGSQFSLHLLLSIPVVTGQVPKPFILPIYSFFPFLYLYP